jgi:hypothetical protein
MPFHGFLGPNPRLTPLDEGSYTLDGAVGFPILQRVKEHVEERLGELRSILCGDDRLKVLASPTTDAALSLAFAVTGKLVAAQFHDIDVVQLGVLIAQCGIFAICAGKL